MGCSSSRFGDTYSPSNKNISSSGKESRNVQDDARSYRSKIGAIKMLTRNERSREALIKFLQCEKKAEFLVCYQDLEEIMGLSEEQAFTRTAAIIWRYKTMYEDVKIHEAKVQHVELLVWDSLGQLRSVDTSNIAYNDLSRLIVVAQNDLLSRLIMPFERFLKSNQYKDWQQGQITEERKRNLSRRTGGAPSISGGASVGTSVRGGGAGAGTGGAVTISSSSVSHHAGNNSATHIASSNVSLASSSARTFSETHPDVLIVDDSVVTLKLTGLTLEKDGHSVDRAENGRKALELLKQRRYDVVLIDLNMPIMDGFETVHSFREYERNAAQEHAAQFGYAHINDKASDMSSISADSGDPRNSEVQATSPTSANRNNRPKSREEAKTKSKSKSRFTNKGLEGIDEEDRELLTPAHFHQLIIGMSTNVDDETRRRAFESGMDFFLPKPFTLQKFTETLRMAIDQQHANSSVRTGPMRRSPSGRDVESVQKTPNDLFDP